MDQSGRGEGLGRRSASDASARAVSGGRQRTAVAEGVARVENPGGSQVYRIAFSYLGVECRETLELPHSRQSDQYCVRLRAEILGKIARGAFDYSEFWPNSRRAVIFGHATQARTVGEALLTYRDRAERTLEHSTFVVYRRDIDRVLIPEFGKIRFQDFRAGHIRDFAVSRSADGMSLKRLRNLLLPLSTVCDEAVADELIAANPVRAVKLAKLVDAGQRVSNYEPSPYSEAELWAVLARLPEMERWTFQFWAYTGIRTGELIGLRWPSVNLKARSVRIADVTSKGVDKPRPKTAAGSRTITLLPAAWQALQGIRSHTQVMGDRVFRNARSTLADRAWRENKLEARWIAAHDGSGVQPRNPYQLRHTFASNLLSQGANPLDIAARLGHKTTEMLSKHYARWIGSASGIRWDDPECGYGQREVDFAIRNVVATGSDG